VCKGSLAAILIPYYVIHPTSIYPCRLQFLYPFDFTPPPQFLPSHVQLVQACLFQYKGFRLYTDVSVRNKVEEESNLTRCQEESTGRAGTQAKTPLKLLPGREVTNALGGRCHDVGPPTGAGLYTSDLSISEPWTTSLTGSRMKRKG
jgi:hypothetical protein